ncbi:hypothetical protein [Meiothermus cerbereus]|uniref:hypothetical protein n=1 Tax=Meiothermus cerbereus TaxID=65552 RepID=UPI000488D496|nr:hypothetical protein [Meiothermus cerbereus]
MPPYSSNYEVPPLSEFERKLKLLPPSLRERALRGWQQEQAERAAAAPTGEPREAEAQRRQTLQAQARLLALTQAERERPTLERVTALQAEARALLSQGHPLAGYARLQEARSLAAGLAAAAFTDPVPLEPFLEALLSPWGLPLRGYDREVAHTLLHLALEVGLHRAYHPITSEVVFHLPQGALALALWPEVKPETGRKRVQRSLARLAEAGLLAFAPRVGNALDRQTGKPLGWKDGTVFRMRLRPGRARPLTREELAYPWRDLEADTHKGRTLLKLRQNPEVSQSPKHPKGVAPIELLKNWALPPAALLQTPLSDWDTRPQDLRAGLRNALQDVKLCARQERPRFVGRTGELLARALRDPGSVNLYRALLWGALRRKDRGEDRFEALWNALDRVLTDLQEGFAKKPGALLIARLRESGLWALLLEGPVYRVA